MMRGWFSLLLYCGTLCYLVGAVLEDNDEFGTSLVASMRNDANLDLSADEEYEDLRAELLAYHTALASLSATPKRRSMLQTACWSLGGVCVEAALCAGLRSLTQVPGCRSRNMVCCSAWNRYKVKDWRHKGLGTPTFPWSNKLEYGGLGVIQTDVNKKKKLSKKVKKLSKKIKKLSLIEGQQSSLEDKEYDEKEIREDSVDHKLSEDISSEEEPLGDNMGAEFVVLGGHDTDALDT